jgi:hypothetical protein
MSLPESLRVPECLRAAALALFLLATAGASRALAQSVIVRSAPPESTVELTMNSGGVVSAKADSNGDATLAVAARGTEADVQFYVDNCGNSLRVLLVERGLQPAPPAPACTRKDIWGVFVMRPVTTFLVEMNGTDPVVYITQGPVPRSWVGRGADAGKQSKLPWGTPQKGLAVSAGGGFSSFKRSGDLACGTASSCASDSTGGALSFGAEYWITRIFAAHVGYLRPSDVTASGGGSGYRFDSRIHARLLTVGGKVGIAQGPMRIYALGGLNRHEATSTTNQTTDDSTVTVGDVTQTIKGGTQTYAQQTHGWNWMLGGGLEAWLTGRVAIYGEFVRAKVKGDPANGGEGGLDDQATFIVGGARVRLWR